MERGGDEHVEWGDAVEVGEEEDVVPRESSQAGLGRHCQGIPMRKSA